MPVYISDDHLIAAWCRMQECVKGEVYNIMHIDCHSDLKGCGHLEILETLRTNPKLTFEEYRDLSYNNGNQYPFF